MTTVECIRNGCYKDVALQYFDWLVDKYEATYGNDGFKTLCRAYTAWAYTGGTTAMQFLKGTQFEYFLREMVTSQGFMLTRRDEEELSWEVEYVLRDRIEMEIHEHNHANP